MDFICLFIYLLIPEKESIHNTGGVWADQESPAGSTPSTEPYTGLSLMTLRTMTPADIKGQTLNQPSHPVAQENELYSYVSILQYNVFFGKYLRKILLGRVKLQIGLNRIKFLTPASLAIMLTTKLT